MSKYPTALDLGPLFAPRPVTGEALKERGMELAAKANAEFVSRMRFEAERIARAKGWVHVDDIRLRAIELGLKPASSAAWGPVFSEKKWRIVGWRASEFPSNHGHRSPVRVLVEDAA